MISIRPLHSLEDFNRCIQIARAVWDESDLETEPLTTFVVAHQSGGQILGAFDGEQLVGFTKAVPGLHGLTPYLHSHMAAVVASHRDRHIGRQLKLAQREDALRRGIRLIEWTFDPFEIKNAHFNLNRLGGICRTYIPNFYGITSSPLHRGMPTDRLLVEWHLDSARAVAAINDLTPRLTDPPAVVHLPSSPSSGGFTRPSFEVKEVKEAKEVKETASSEFSASFILLQSRIREEFTRWFSKGYAATAIRLTPSGADYCLSPYSDF